MLGIIKNKKQKKDLKKSPERYYEEKKQEYGRERYKNISEDEKQKLVKYGKRYYEMRKKRLMFYNITKNHLKKRLNFYKRYDKFLFS